MREQRFQIEMDLVAWDSYEANEVSKASEEFAERERGRERERLTGSNC